MTMRAGCQPPLNGSSRVSETVNSLGRRNGAREQLSKTGDFPPESARAAKLLMPLEMFPEPAPEATVRCPRCDSDDIEALGRVHSTLYWFSCFRCHCIWWLRSLPAGHDAPRAAISDS